MNKTPEKFVECIKQFEDKFKEEIVKEYPGAIAAVTKVDDNEYTVTVARGTTEYLHGWIKRDIDGDCKWYVNKDTTLRPQSPFGSKWSF